MKLHDGVYTFCPVKILLYTCRSGVDVHTNRDYVLSYIKDVL